MKRLTVGEIIDKAKEIENIRNLHDRSRTKLEFLDQFKDPYTHNLVSKILHEQLLLGCNRDRDYVIIEE